MFSLKSITQSGDARSLSLPNETLFAHIWRKAMTMLFTETRQICNHIFRQWICIASLFFLLTTGVNAQTTGATDGTTPLALAPGAPAGSYALSEFDSINLYNGSLNFRLPLLHIGGRGDAQYTMTLPIEQHWTVRHRVNEQEELHYPEFNWWNLLKPGYGPGVLVGRKVNDNRCDIFGQFFNTQSLTRLTFTAPDGTEYELRDQDTNGETLLSTCPYYTSGGPGASRGKVFVAADGSDVTFISDTTIYDTNAFGQISGSNVFRASGYLIFRNGVRYRIDGGLVSWIRDRNGNKLTFGYGPRGITSITDSLNRRVTISYADYQTVFYDEITFHGYGGAARAIRINYSLLSTVLRSGSVRTYAQLFPELSGASTTTLVDFYMVSSVTLNNNQQYQFRYNSYGELARVVLPTGGVYEYDFGSSDGNLQGSGVMYVGTFGIYRRVWERRVYSDSSTLVGKTAYSKPQNVSGAVSSHQVYVIVDHLASDGTTVLAREKHYFFGDPIDSLFPPDAFSYPAWKDGKEFQTEYGITTTLRRVVQNWQQRAAVSWWTGDPDRAPANDPSIVETVATLVDANLVSKQAFAYDQYNNRTDVYEYDLGAGAPGPLIRRTHTSYLTTNGNQGNIDYAADVNIHIRNLPVQQVVYDASGNVRSQADFIYDDYGAYQLVDRPGIVQHDGAFHAGYGARGNLTGVIHRNPDGSPSEIHLHNQYDIAGNLVKAVDGRGFPTDFEYSDRFGIPDDEARSNAGPPELAGGFTYAFPTRVTNALGQTAYTQYDYYLAKPVNTEDANGVVSSVAYNDALGRPTQGIQARYVVGVGMPAMRRQTTFVYDDANRVITTTGDLNTFNDNALTSKSYYDSLGRARRSAARESSTWTITDTEFDALGRVSQVSNPYRATDPDSTSPPSGPWAEWTTTHYDSLGRMISVTTPDGAHVDTAYSGNQVTGADQAGKRLRSETDALGRLVKVTEDPGGVNYETYYSYDVLGNLRQVTQGSQTRTFAYDSLSRLISATNPESGTMTYAYDPNGNLLEKTDARGVKTMMTYDTLNRARSKVYSGTTPENATPPVNYFYDDYSGLPSGAPSWPGTPSKGRLIGVTYGPGSEGTYYKYDAAGRIVTNHQRMGTSNYATAYFYNLAGAVTREERGIPARRRILSGYDAAGRLATMDTGSYPFLTYVPLVGNISYTPFGALQSETYGNGLIHSMAYNSRHQPTEIRLGRPDDLEAVFRLGYIYGTASNVNGQDPEITAAHNNGNVARIKYLISGTVQYTQTFQYDPLNRLSYAVEHNNDVHDDGARAWYQTFDYDRYGNRGINVANTSDNVDAANSALKLAEFSGANNRIMRAGFVYDAAGNLIEEPGKRYTYDAENRIIMTTVEGGATSQYVYGGNGRRVKKIVGGVATRFEYGAGDELIAERNDSNSNVIKDYFYKGGELLATTKAGASGEYQYATADHLGSPRAWTDGSGNLTAGGRHDYSPFGEELFAGVGIRSASLSYGTDSTRQKFTSRERDDETGLDFFEARYYSSIQGRFTSPDIPFADQTEDEPQSWNLYAYVTNNPLKFIDPFGLWKRINTDDGTIVYEAEKGDTLAGLADILQVPVDALVGSLGGDKVQIGQRFDVTNYQDYKSDSQKINEFFEYFQDRHPTNNWPSNSGLDPSAPWLSHYPGLSGTRPRSNPLGSNTLLSKGRWLEIKEAARELAETIRKEAKVSRVGAGARSGQHGKPLTVAAARLRELLKQNEKNWLPEFKEVIEKKIQEWTNKAKTINEKIGGSGKQ
jgi:RHS repeat-associated protein